MTSALPLEDFRVLELGHIIARPSAGLLLADLGADVVKVERPGESIGRTNATCSGSLRCRTLARHLHERQERHLS